MFKMKKVFILYARFGEGHWQAATALRHSFERQGNTEVLLIDLLAESHPVINEVSRFVYKKSYHVLPQVYGWVYEVTKGMKSDSVFATWLHSFGTLALQKLVERELPDAIIHTFPILVLPTVAHRVGRKIPMFNVVTDFDLHQ
jgi:processive 1,2-diacylglycerol beta-glucosyltransferase